ncbi:MAG: hypothetical protein Kow009_05230 [Spirochaetales bacterium]
MSMYHRQLKALLEERLTFYENLMNRLAESIEEEDTDRIEYYQGLEQETLRSLANLEKCVAALSRIEPSNPSPYPLSEEERDIDNRVTQARLRALEATRHNCSLIRKQLKQLKDRMSHVRPRTIPQSYKEVTPAYLDLDI